MDEAEERASHTHDISVNILFFASPGHVKNNKNRHVSIVVSL